MKKARAALKILHEQDIDGLSASLAGSVSVSCESLDSTISISHSNSNRSPDRLSLTSQHLNPRLKTIRDEREEEVRITQVDESKGVYRELIVAYGNRLQVIGLLLVEDSTTFEKAHSMVKHMVRKFFEPTFEIIGTQLQALSMELNQAEIRRRDELRKQLEDTEFLCEHYFLADSNGKRVLNIETNRQRFVWSECVRNDYYLMILPANGTYVDDEPRGENDVGLLEDDTLDGDFERENEEGDHMSDDGTGFGLLPLPSVMSDDMVPSITSTNNR